MKHISKYLTKYKKMVEDHDLIAKEHEIVGRALNAYSKVLDHQHERISALEEKCKDIEAKLTQK